MNFGKSFFKRVDDAYGRGASRLASLGLASVMIVLSITAMWGELSTNRAAQEAKRFSELSDAFEQARFAVAAESGQKAVPPRRSVPWRRHFNAIPS